MAKSNSNPLELYTYVRAYRRYLTPSPSPVRFTLNPAQGYHPLAPSLSSIVVAKLYIHKGVEGFHIMEAPTFSQTAYCYNWMMRGVKKTYICVYLIVINELLKSAIHGALCF